jgi:hypothetical protein
MRLIKLTILAFFLSALAGCRTVNYKINPDESREVRYTVFGFDTKVGSLEIEATKDTRKLKLTDLDTSSARSIEVLGKIVDKIPNPPIIPIIP